MTSSVTPGASCRYYSTRACQIRNPRPETRTKPEIRSPKEGVEQRASSFRGGQAFGFRASDFLRISGLGFRILGETERHHTGGSWQIRAGITLAVLAALVIGTVVILKQRSQAAVTVTLRIAVTPGEQVGFVTGRASSAQFKYVMGKQAGVKPALAQKLSLKPVPHSSLVEARIAVLTKEEGRRYAEVFVETLQDLCGGQAQLTLAEQTIH